MLSENFDFCAGSNASPEEREDFWFLIVGKGAENTKFKEKKCSQECELNLL